MRITEIAGGVTAAKGFSAGGVHAGVKSKKAEKKDVAIIYSDTPAFVGGVFTQNKFCAAPVSWCRKVVAQGSAQAIVANSGNANACTGQQGLDNAAAMAQLTAELLHIEKEQVLVASTGVIGQQLPMDVVAQGIRGAYGALSPEGSDMAAEAIMTTDTFAKTMAVCYEWQGKTITVGGIAKGSGMIHPNMATMLCFITTDCAVTPAAMNLAVKTAADKGFNMVTVDQDTSTNDTCIVLANGQAGNQTVDCGGPGYEEFSQALSYVMMALAKMMAKDGEGATKLLEVTVSGALTEQDARLAAKAVVSSNLVKSAFFGEDANWGRIVCAVGYSGAEFDTAKVDMWIQSLAGKEQMMASGTPLEFSETLASKILAEKEIQVLIALNQGTGEATAWGCDLSYDYIKINADYRT